MHMHYNSTLYRSNTLREAATQYLEFIPLSCTHLISAGMSGGAIASAILALAKSRPQLAHRHFYVKEFSTSYRGHKKGTAGLCLEKCHVGMLVDDLAETGDTLLALKLRVVESCDCSIIGALIGTFIDGLGDSAQKIVNRFGFPITDVEKGITLPPRHKKEEKPL